MDENTVCPIVFETRLDAQATKAAARYSVRRLWWLYLLLSLIWVAIGVVNIVNPDDPDVAFGVALIVVGVLFTPACILMTFAIVAANNRKMPLLSDDTTETYTFDPDGMTLVQRKGADYESTTRARYNCFNKAVSTRTHYYLYLSAQQCHVICKADIVQGSTEDLDAIFARSFGIRFVHN